MERRRTRPTVETAVIKPPIWLLWPARYVLGLFNLAYDQPKPAERASFVIVGFDHSKAVQGSQQEGQEGEEKEPEEPWVMGFFYGRMTAVTCLHALPKAAQHVGATLSAVERDGTDVSNLGVMPGTGRYWTVG
ncbi:hypothetical protein WJX73_001183 [Symbiochloris irregularis]|uniref:Uncharacterized protein n=1 Tax=Symbiochloris irregularis TaxID=706552 RepID=A0AAW1NPU7_9CHLO